MFVVGMGSYHIIPSQFLFGRLIYFISLYGLITGLLFHLRSNSLEKKHKQFYLIASLYSVSKMIYHLWISVTKYNYENYAIEYKKALIEYQKGLIDYESVVMLYNNTVVEHKFTIFGVECELIASIFSLVVFMILIMFKINNDGRMDKRKSGIV